MNEVADSDLIVLSGVDELYRRGGVEDRNAVIALECAQMGVAGDDQLGTGGAFPEQAGDDRVSVNNDAHRARPWRRRSRLGFPLRSWVVHRLRAFAPWPRTIRKDGAGAHLAVQQMKTGKVAQDQVAMYTVF